jgi:ubiquinone/menaquinone biosynthesis C-methylase UbiE/DNA-binding transcriptional ArsR family regulator
MKNLTAAPDALLGWMGTLADPVRLRLLRLLERNELAVDELRDVLQLPQSTVSRHLKVLADEGLTRSRRHGTTNLYRTILDELEPAARKLWLLAREQTEKWPAVQQDQLRLARRLRERQTDSQTFFSAAAGQWDKLRGELYGEASSVAALLALLPPDWVVADLGCGTGWASAMLAPNVKQVIAVDSSAAMLKAARKRTQEFSNIDLRRGELEVLPIEDASCDAALLLLVLTYASDEQKVLAEMSRILKPGGRAVVMDLLPHDRDDFRRQMGQRSMGFAPETITQLFTACSLEHSVVRPLPPEPNTKGPALFLASATRAI